MVHGANFDTLMNGYTLNFLSIMTFSDFQGHDSFLDFRRLTNRITTAQIAIFATKLSDFNKKWSKISQGEKIQSIVQRTKK